MIFGVVSHNVQHLVSVKVGNLMNFSIGAKPEMVLIGIKITKINYQLNTEKRDCTSSLFKNYLSTKSYPNDGSIYAILANFNDDGYDYYIATNQENAFFRDCINL